MYVCVRASLFFSLCFISLHTQTSVTVYWYMESFFSAHFSFLLYSHVGKSSIVASPRPTTKKKCLENVFGFNPKKITGGAGQREDACEESPIQFQQSVWWRLSVYARSCNNNNINGNGDSYRQNVCAFMYIPSLHSPKGIHTFALECIKKKIHCRTDVLIRTYTISLKPAPKNVDYDP